MLHQVSKQRSRGKERLRMAEEQEEVLLDWAEEEQAQADLASRHWEADWEEELLLDLQPERRVCPKVPEV